MRPVRYSLINPVIASKSTIPARCFVFLNILTVAILFSLGIWQVRRAYWKRNLIARIETGMAAAPSPAPEPGTWSHFTATTSEYRRVWATGRFLGRDEACVTAVTILGPGFWVMKPFQADDGFTVLVNRGFVASCHADAETTRRWFPPGRERVDGILRASEAKGAFLRSNDPAADRWYSRDVDAIGARMGLRGIAPYFIDEDATDDPRSPVGGLTVLSIPNNHAVYAITWFALAGLLGGFGRRAAFRRRSPPR